MDERASVCACIIHSGEIELISFNPNTGLAGWMGAAATGNGPNTIEFSKLDNNGSLYVALDGRLR